MSLLSVAAFLASLAVGAIAFVHTRNVIRWWSDGDLELKIVRAASVVWFGAVIMLLGWLMAISGT